jgi:hypothetical protein
MFFLKICRDYKGLSPFTKSLLADWAWEMPYSQLLKVRDEVVKAAKEKRMGY